MPLGFGSSAARPALSSAEPPRPSTSKVVGGDRGRQGAQAARGRTGERPVASGAAGSTARPSSGTSRAPSARGSSRAPSSDTRAGSSRPASASVSNINSKSVGFSNIRAGNDLSASAQGRRQPSSTSIRHQDLSATAMRGVDTSYGANGRAQSASNGGLAAKDGIWSEIALLTEKLARVQQERGPMDAIAHLTRAASEAVAAAVAAQQRGLPAHTSLPRSVQSSAFTPLAATTRSDYDYPIAGRLSFGGPSTASAPMHGHPSSSYPHAQAQARAHPSRGQQEEADGGESDGGGSEDSRAGEVGIAVAVQQLTKAEVKRQLGALGLLQEGGGGGGERRGRPSPGAPRSLVSADIPALIAAHTAPYPGPLVVRSPSQLERLPYLHPGATLELDFSRAAEEAEGDEEGEGEEQGGVLGRGQGAREHWYPRSHGNVLQAQDDAHTDDSDSDEGEEGVGRGATAGGMGQGGSMSDAQRRLMAMTLGLAQPTSPPPSRSAAHMGQGLGQGLSASALANSSSSGGGGGGLGGVTMALSPLHAPSHAHSTADAASSTSPQLAEPTASLAPPPPTTAHPSVALLADELASVKSLLLGLTASLSQEGQGVGKGKQGGGLHAAPRRQRSVLLSPPPPPLDGVPVDGQGEEGEGEQEEEGPPPRAQGKSPAKSPRAQGSRQGRYSSPQPSSSSSGSAGKGVKGEGKAGTPHGPNPPTGPLSPPSGRGKAAPALITGEPYIAGAAFDGSLPDDNAGDASSLLALAEGEPLCVVAKMASGWWYAHRGRLPGEVKEALKSAVQCMDGPGLGLPSPAPHTTPVALAAALGLHWSYSPSLPCCAHLPRARRLLSGFVPGSYCDPVPHGAQGGQYQATQHPAEEEARRVVVEVAQAQAVSMPSPPTAAVPALAASAGGRGARGSKRAVQSPPAASPAPLPAPVPIPVPAAPATTSSRATRPPAPTPARRAGGGTAPVSLSAGGNAILARLMREAGESPESEQGEGEEGQGQGGQGAPHDRVAFPPVTPGQGGRVGGRGTPGASRTPGYDVSSPAGRLAAQRAAATRAKLSLSVGARGDVVRSAMAPPAQRGERGRGLGKGSVQFDEAALNDSSVYKSMSRVFGGLGGGGQEDGEEQEEGEGEGGGSDVHVAQDRAPRGARPPAAHTPARRSAAPVQISAATLALGSTSDAADPARLALDPVAQLVTPRTSSKSTAALAAGADWTALRHAYAQLKSAAAAMDASVKAARTPHPLPHPTPTPAPAPQPRMGSRGGAWAEQGEDMMSFMPTFTDLKSVRPSAPAPAPVVASPALAAPPQAAQAQVVAQAQVHAPVPTQQELSPMRTAYSSTGPSTLPSTSRGGSARHGGGGWASPESPPPPPPPFSPPPPPAPAAAAATSATAVGRVLDFQGDMSVQQRQAPAPAAAPSPAPVPVASTVRLSTSTASGAASTAAGGEGRVVVRRREQEPPKSLHTAAVATVLATQATPEFRLALPAWGGASAAGTAAPAPAPAPHPPSQPGMGGQQGSAPSRMVLKPYKPANTLQGMATVGPAAVAPAPAPAPAPPAAPSRSPTPAPSCACYSPAISSRAAAEAHLADKAHGTYILWPDDAAAPGSSHTYMLSVRWPQGRVGHVQVHHHPHEGEEEWYSIPGSTVDGGYKYRSVEEVVETYKMRYGQAAGGGGVAGQALPEHKHGQDAEEEEEGGGIGQSPLKIGGPLPGSSLPPAPAIAPLGMSLPGTGMVRGGAGPGTGVGAGQGWRGGSPPSTPGWSLAYSFSTSAAGSAGGGGAGGRREEAPRGSPRQPPAVAPASVPIATAGSGSLGSPVGGPQSPAGSPATAGPFKRAQPTPTPTPAPTPPVHATAQALHHQAQAQAVRAAPTPYTPAGYMSQGGRGGGQGAGVVGGGVVAPHMRRKPVTSPD